VEYYGRNLLLNTKEEHSWFHIAGDIYFSRDFNIIARKDSISKLQLDHSVIKSAIPKLVIPLTYDCNLACKYCINEAIHDYRFTVSNVKSIVERFFEYAIKSGWKEIIVEFSHGGEPTLAMEDLKNILLFIDGLPKNILVIKSIETNAFFGNNTCNYIINNFDMVVVSLDGPDEVNNLNRRSRSDNNSFDIVFNNAKLFYDEGLLHRISCVVVSDNEIYLNRIVRFFNNNFQSTEIRYGKLIPKGCAKDFSVNIEWNKVIQFILNNSTCKSHRISGVPYSDSSNSRGCIYASNPSWFLRSNMQISVCPNPSVEPSLLIGEIIKDKVVMYNKTIRSSVGFGGVVSSKCSGCLLEYSCPNRCIRTFGNIDCARRTKNFKLLLVRLIGSENFKSLNRSPM
jgi:sulfatase maturation enzyme AslB (radical SAM superfamily)